MIKIEVHDYYPKYLIDGVEYMGNHEKITEDAGTPDEYTYFSYSESELAIEIICKAFPQIDKDKFDSVSDSSTCGDGCCSFFGHIFSYDGNGEVYIEDGYAIDYYVKDLLALAGINKDLCEVINNGQVYEQNENI